MAKFPPDFSDLEQFGDWSIHIEADRIKEVTSRSDDALQALYEAMLPRMGAIVTHLNSFPLHEMPDRERNLLDLSKMMIEAAAIVEHGRSVIGPYFDITRFVPINE